MREQLFRLWIAAGAVAGLLGVAMAAVTAHAVLDPLKQAMLHSAVEMQVWHALALVAVGIWVRIGGGDLAHWAGAAFLVGLICFSSSIYSLALLDMRIPMLAPIGGTLLMIGWAFLGLSALRAR
jgi:uncharacterized membrane protein YgdD (TMEM256/DUF423 family)